MGDEPIQPHSPRTFANPRIKARFEVVAMTTASGCRFRSGRSAPTQWMIYWRPSAFQAWAPSEALDRPFALRVTPLLRELIFAAFDPDATPDKTELVVRLILHELTETPDAPTFLPLPARVIGRRGADWVISDPRSQLDIGELASRAATSVRSISRRFPVETGLIDKAWRQRARIVLAIDQLSDRSPA